MKTLILSSSLSPNSRSYILCQAAQQQLVELGVEVTLVDARDMALHPTHRLVSEDMEQLKQQIADTDNIVIGMGVHCYSLSDSLKMILDTCFEHATGKFFGILCAAGGTRSYLATMHVTQICMNERRMIQLPRVVFASGKDFHEDKITDETILERMGLFVEEFVDVGTRLTR